MQRSSLAVLLLASIAPIHGAFAQQAPQPTLTQPGTRSTLTATIAERLEFDSNYRLDDPSPGDTFFADTTFALDYLQETELRQLGLGFDVGARALWEADEDFGWEVASPSGAYLTFNDEGPYLAFDADLEISSRQVTYTDDIIDSGGEDLPDDLSELEGDTRETRYDADIGVVLGPDAPSSLELRFIGSKWEYSDDEDDDQTPRQTAEGQGFWTVQVSPVLSAGLFGSYLHYTADNAAETEVNVAEGDVGLVYDPSDVLQVAAAVGYADRTREDFGDETQSDSGITVRGNANYILPDFTVDAEGRFTTAAPDPQFSFNLRTAYTLARSQIIGRVFNRYTGASTGGSDELRVTGASLGFVQDLNTVSRVSLDLSYAHQTNLDDDDDPDIDRADLTASYIHDLTEAVTAEIGYGYRTRVEDPQDAQSHRLFLVLGRTFETGL
jgi:hypothetical protein